MGEEENNIEIQKQKQNESKTKDKTKPIEAKTKRRVIPEDRATCLTKATMLFFCEKRRPSRKIGVYSFNERPNATRE
jgi:hypothetical protein